MLDSLEDLLSQIAPGKHLTEMYAAASNDIISRCPHSRRTWELLVDVASEMNLPINTKHCSTDHVQAATDILSNPGGIIVASWEHTNIPALVGWIMALAVNKKANKPIEGFPKWNGKVFDQFWVVDLRGKKPTFSIYPQRILPTDCPYAREPSGKCPNSLFGEDLDEDMDQSSDNKVSSTVLIIYLIVFTSLVLLILYLGRKHITGVVALNVNI